MSTILIQNTKGKTFAEICPTWSSILEQVMDIPIHQNRSWKLDELSLMHDVNLYHSTRCVFGEAHGWSANYERSELDRCGGCTNLVYGMTGIIGIAQFGTRDDFEAFKPKFMAHFNEVHLK